MSEDRFKEILEEIFDSKIEIIQMIDTIDKKLEKLILARAYFQSEPAPTLIGIPDTPVKKESNTKVKEKVITKGALVAGLYHDYFKDGESKSWIVINEEFKVYAFVPKSFGKQTKAGIMVHDWVVEKYSFMPKWKPFTDRFWEVKTDE